MAQSAGPGIVTGAVVEPRPRSGVSNPSPDYPRASRVRGEQGRVTLLVQVGLDGRVTDLAVLGSSGHEALDRAAEAAVRRWQFEPATQQGRPVFSTTTVSIIFRLEQDAFAPRR
jgi:protein TonB